MDRDEIIIHHSSIITTNPEIEINGINRRNFIIYLSFLPLTTLPSRSDAFWQLIPIGIRIFARPLLRYVTKGIFKPQAIARPRINVPSRASIAIDKAIKINNHRNDIINTGVLLADELWKQGSKNSSSSVITNTSDQPHNTGDIKIQLRDTDTAHVDVQATIEPLIIPPKSKLILEIGFSNLPSEGMKRLHGTYNSNKQGNERQRVESSGRILVAHNTRGVSISELYRRYNRNYNGGTYTF